MFDKVKEYLKYKKLKADYTSKKAAIQATINRNKVAASAAAKNGIADRLDKKIAEYDSAMSTCKINLLVRILSLIGI